MDTLLKSRRSSLLASLATQNATLKISLIVSAGVIGVLTLGLLIIALRKPLVIGLSESTPVILGTRADTVGISTPEIKAFVYDLMARKFPKSPTKENLELVCRYFVEGASAACQKEIQNRKTFISQDILIQEVTWNDQTSSAFVMLKRFANFGGTISSIENAITLKITKRSRTIENPWGLFIENWKEDLKK